MADLRTTRYRFRPGRPHVPPTCATCDGKRTVTRCQRPGAPHVNAPVGGIVMLWGTATRVRDGFCASLEVKAGHTYCGHRVDLDHPCPACTPPDYSRPDPACTRDDCYGQGHAVCDAGHHFSAHDHTIGGPCTSGDPCPGWLHLEPCPDCYRATRCPLCNTLPGKLHRDSCPYANGGPWAVPSPDPSTVLHLPPGTTVTIPAAGPLGAGTVLISKDTATADLPVPADVTCTAGHVTPAEHWTGRCVHPAAPDGSVCGHKLSAYTEAAAFPDDRDIALAATLRTMAGVADDHGLTGAATSAHTAADWLALAAGDDSRDTAKCPRCHGKGSTTVLDVPCTACGGTGKCPTHASRRAVCARGHTTPAKDWTGKCRHSVSPSTNCGHPRHPDYCPACWTMPGHALDCDLLRTGG
jgi:hypothetical protein